MKTKFNPTRAAASIATALLTALLFFVLQPVFNTITTSQPWGTPAAGQQNDPNGEWQLVDSIELPGVCTYDWGGGCAGQTGPKPYSLQAPSWAQGLEGKIEYYWLPKGDPDKPQQPNERFDVSDGWGDIYCPDGGDTNSPPKKCGETSGVLNDTYISGSVTHADLRINDEFTHTSAGSTKGRADLYVWIPEPSTPTPEPSLTPEPSITPTATATETDIPTLTPTSTATETDIPTLTPTGTITPTLTPTITLTPTVTLTATPGPSATPSPSPSPSPSPTPGPSQTPSPTPSASPTPSPSPTPTNTPTNTPTPTPSKTPTITPTPSKTPTPTKTPSVTPTNTPTSPPPNAGKPSVADGYPLYEGSLMGRATINGHDFKAFEAVVDKTTNEVILAGDVDLSDPMDGALVNWQGHLIAHRQWSWGWIDLRVGSILTITVSGEEMTFVVTSISEEPYGTPLQPNPSGEVVDLRTCGSDESGWTHVLVYHLEEVTSQ